MESAAVISGALEEYFGSNTHDPDLLCQSIKTLIKLISNALQKKDAKYRKLRYYNTKIQELVVRPPGALDVLALVGFYTEVDDGGGWNKNNQERYIVFNDGEEERVAGIGKLVTHQLETRLTELEAKRSYPKATAPSQPVSSDTGPFLSNEERKKRQEIAKRKKKEREAAKKESMKRWEEDKDSRKEIEDRKTRAKEAALQKGAKDFATRGDISIKRLNSPADTVSGPPLGPQKKLEASPAHPLLARMLQKDSSPSPAETNATHPEESLKPAAVNSVVAVDSQESRKPTPHSVAAAHPSTEDSEERKNQWKTYLENIPRCGPAEKIRETSVLFQKEKAASATSSPACLRKLLRELDDMKESLPTDSRCSIWVRFDEETPQYIRALIAAALPGPTPYNGGLFAFDIYVPNDYPAVSPKMQLLTTGGGRVRFGPNLYACGKVCLSLLGTWEGEAWNPRLSTLNQLLFSIQGLILGAEHPYFLEPGHGGWEGKIKEGTFEVEGRKLTGEVVRDEVKLPKEAAAYEDGLRIATLRFAMLEMIQATRKGHADGDCKTGVGALLAENTAYLDSFVEPILAHFSHNRETILKQVQPWLGGRAFTSNKQEEILGTLSKLYERLERELNSLKVIAAFAPPKESNGPDAVISDLVEPPAKQQAPANVPQTKEAPGGTEPGGDLRKKPPPGHSVEKEKNMPNSIDDIRKMIQESASRNDFITAGKLQADLQAIETLDRDMHEAAAQGNFIRAGKLQEQIRARLAAVEDIQDDERKQSARMKDLMGGSEGSSAGGDSEGEDDSSEFGVIPPAPTSFPPVAAGVPAPGGATKHFPKNVYPPHNVRNRANRRHNWGDGQALNSAGTGTALSVPTEHAEGGAKATTNSAALDKKTARPRSGVLCHLRLRLPGATKSITEDFDGEDTLADVYHRIEPYVDPELQNNKNAPPPIAPVARRKPVMTEYGMQMVKPAAFENPLSLKGFTLLLSRPKREFSLEMHGTKTLHELGLVPTASLNVMLCKERGMVRRGDLEGRLSQAQGDAMDVDGLGYEGLMELTERIGISEKDWSEEDERNVEQNSRLICPSDYLAGLQADEDSVSSQDRRCPICLGEFDEADMTPCLRQLKTCPHTFHTACLSTWLRTKVSCPICNTSITS